LGGWPVLHGGGFKAIAEGPTDLVEKSFTVYAPEGFALTLRVIDDGKMLQVRKALESYKAQTDEMATERSLVNFARDGFVLLSRIADHQERL
jgi:hypothetical protein